MQTRRLLVTAPLAAFATTVLVSAVIASGQRSLAGDLRLPQTADPRPGVAAETARIDDALHAERACVGAIECDALRTARRIGEAADGIDGWPADNRFAHVRRALQAELRARAAMIQQQALAATDGRETREERDHAESLRADWTDAARARILAQRDARLLSELERDAALDDLRAHRH